MISLFFFCSLRTILSVKSNADLALQLQRVPSGALEDMLLDSDLLDLGLALRRCRSKLPLRKVRIRKLYAKLLRVFDGVSIVCSESIYLRPYYDVFPGVTSLELETVKDQYDGAWLALSATFPNVERFVFSTRDGFYMSAGWMNASVFPKLVALIASKTKSVQGSWGLERLDSVRDIRVLSLQNIQSSVGDSVLHFADPRKIKCLSLHSLYLEFPQPVAWWCSLKDLRQLEVKSTLRQDIVHALLKREPFGLCRLKLTNKGIFDRNMEELILQERATLTRLEVPSCLYASTFSSLDCLVRLTLCIDRLDNDIKEFLTKLPAGLVKIELCFISSSTTSPPQLTLSATIKRITIRSPETSLHWLPHVFKTVSGPTLSISVHNTGKRSDYVGLDVVENQAWIHKKKRKVEACALDATLEDQATKTRLTIVSRE